MGALCIHSVPVAECVLDIVRGCDEYFQHLLNDDRQRRPREPRLVWAVEEASAGCTLVDIALAAIGPVSIYAFLKDYEKLRSGVLMMYRDVESIVAYLSKRKSKNNAPIYSIREITADVDEAILQIIENKKGSEGPRVSVFG